MVQIEDKKKIKNTDDVQEAKKEKRNQREKIVCKHTFGEWHLFRNCGFIAGSYTAKDWEGTVFIMIIMQIVM